MCFLNVENLIRKLVGLDLSTWDGGLIVEMVYECFFIEKFLGMVGLEVLIIKRLRLRGLIFVDRMNFRLVLGFRGWEVARRRC